MNIIKYKHYFSVFVMFFLIACSKETDREDLEYLIKTEQYESVPNLIDDYIEKNNEDELGYYVKAIALINTGQDYSDILPVLDMAFLKSPSDKVEQYAYAMSVMLLQNRYCDESLSIASKLGFNLHNPDSREFSLFAIGYADCVSLSSYKSKSFIINLYERLLLQTTYNYELIESYITYLANINKWDVAEKVVERYNVNKPRTKHFNDLLNYLKERSKK